MQKLKINSVYSTFFVTFYDSFIHSLICRFVRSFIHSFAGSFVRSFIHSPLRSFIHSFAGSFIHPFIRRFIHSFAGSFIHSCRILRVLRGPWLLPQRCSVLQPVPTHLLPAAVSRSDQPQDPAVHQGGQQCRSADQGGRGGHSAIVHFQLRETHQVHRARLHRQHLPG